MKKKLSVKLPAVDESTSTPRSFGAWTDEADLQVVDLDPEDWSSIRLTYRSISLIVHLPGGGPCLAVHARWTDDSTGGGRLLSRAVKVDCSVPPTRLFCKPFCF